MNPERDGIGNGQRKDFTEIYNLRLTKLERAKADLKRILQRLIDDEESSRDPGAFIADPVTARVKTLTSIVRKASQRNIDPIEGLDLFGDMVGVRVVCRGLGDVQRIVEKIEIHPDIFVDNQDEPHRITTGNKTGYRGRHLEVRVKTNDGVEIVEVKAEIQLRTTIQHAWADVSRHDFYARENDSNQRPEWLVDQLRRLSDQGFELDRQLQDVRDTVAKQYFATARLLKNSVGNLISSGQFEQALTYLEDSIKNEQLTDQLAAIETFMHSPELWHAADRLAEPLNNGSEQVKERFADLLENVQPGDLPKLSPLISILIG